MNPGWYVTTQDIGGNVPEGTVLFIPEWVRRDNAPGREDWSPVGRLVYNGVPLWVVPSWVASVTVLDMFDL